jgi:hypothetical protein
MKKLSVVLLALVMAFAWTASAFAEATPYASIRFATFYKAVDNGAVADTADLVFDLEPAGKTSRLGIKFKVSDEVSGLVETRLISAGNVVGLRHAFGAYKFGAGELLIGQTWAPYSVFFGQVFDDTAGLRQGSAANRAPQVRMTFTPGVYVALIQSALTNSDAEDIEIPEIAVGYKGKAGDIGFGIHGAYVGADNATDPSSYAIMADINAKLGAVGLMGRAFYGQDVNNLLNGGFFLSTGTTSGDLKSWGLIGSVNFNPSDKVGITIGAAYSDTEAAAGDDNNELVVWANAPIKVTKGFTIVPEIAYIDALDVAGLGNATTTADNALWVGAKWQFDL